MMATALAVSVGLAASVVRAATVEEADAHLAAGRFEAAAAAYHELVGANAADARAWARLGFARHGLGQFREAIAAFTRAEPLHALPQTMAFRIARAHARLGETEQAFVALERAIAGGFNQVAQLGSDPDLESLRADSRFAAALEGAAREARPCALDPAYRGADFMLGEWRVMYQGRSIGTARISRAADGCAVVEEYSQPDVPGSDGRLMTYFDARLGRWRQVYVDASGNVNDLSGVATAIGMELSGESHPRKGPAQSLRVSLEKLAPGGFRQVSAQSRDGGATWQPLYDIQYLPLEAK